MYQFLTIPLGFIEVFNGVFIISNGVFKGVSLQVPLFHWGFQNCYWWLYKFFCGFQRGFNWGFHLDTTTCPGTWSCVNPPSTLLIFIPKFFFFTLNSRKPRSEISFFFFLYILYHVVWDIKFWVFCCCVLLERQTSWSGPRCMFQLRIGCHAHFFC